MSDTSQNSQHLGGLAGPGDNPPFGSTVCGPDGVTDAPGQVTAANIETIAQHSAEMSSEPKFDVISHPSVKGDSVQRMNDFDKEQKAREATVLKERQETEAKQEQARAQQKRVEEDAMGLIHAARNNSSLTNPEAVVQEIAARNGINYAALDNFAGGRK